MFIHNGATGLNFAISAKDIAYALEHPSPAPIREVQAKSNPVRAVPLYWIQRTVSGRTASMILTRKIEEYTEVLRGNTSSDILGSVFPHEVPDSKRLFRYIDSRQPGASQHRYSTRDIKLKDLPRGVLRDTSYPETWVLTQSGDGRFPVYRTSLVAGGQRRERGATRPRPNVATVDIFSREYNHRVHTKEFDTVQGSGIFGKTGIAFYVRAHASILHPIYAVSRQAGGQTTYYYTSKIESLTEQMSANKPGDIREFQGLLGFAFPYPRRVRPGSTHTGTPAAVKGDIGSSNTPRSTFLRTWPRGMSGTWKQVSDFGSSCSR